MASTLSIRPLDAAFVAALCGVAAGFALPDVNAGAVTWRSAAAAIWAVIAAVILYCSLGRSWWLSRLHDESGSNDGKSLVRLTRRVGRKLPTPYPDAWYAVAVTQELRPGQVQEVVVCGKPLIVFRPHVPKGQTKWPEPAVLDAYCPHLGAHLYKGGGSVTEDGCIRCPFHGWCFNTEGKLVHIPAGDAPPPGGASDIRKYPSIERNGLVSVWMSSAQLRAELPPVARLRSSCSSGSAAPTLASSSAGPSSLATTNPGVTTPTSCGSEHRDLDTKGQAGGAREREELVNAPTDPVKLAQLAAGAPSSVASNSAWAPWYTPPLIPCLTGEDSEFVLHGCSENLVNACIFELPENGADVTHLPALHGEFFLPSLRWLFNHRWAATWRQNEADAWRTDITVDEFVQLRGVDIPGTRVAVTIIQSGATQVYLNMSVPVVGKVYVVQFVTPVSPMQQRVVHCLYAAPSVPRAFAKLVLLATVRQFERDVPIWCNKIYKNPPVLTQADSAIRGYRGWIRQFFAREGAISFEEAVRAHNAGVLGLPEDANPLDW